MTLTTVQPAVAQVEQRAGAPDGLVVGVGRHVKRGRRHERGG